MRDLPRPTPETGSTPTAYDVKRQSARSGVFATALQGFQFVGGSVAGIIMARLLAPDIFGVFFMVMVATELTSSFRDQGIPHAISRSDGLPVEVRNALFYSHLRFNLVVSGAIVAVSPLLALFFGERDIVSLALILATSLAIQGATNVHLGTLRQQLKFGREAVIDTAALIGSVALGILAATQGWGLWSLAVQHASAHLFHAGAVLASTGWRPQRAPISPSAQAVLDDVRLFGGPLSKSRLLLHLARHVDRVVVGRVAGSGALGLYQTAYNWSVLPVRQVTGPILHIVSTALARVRHTADVYRSWFSIAFFGICGICMPVLAGVAVTAPTLVVFLLGPEWEGSALLLQILMPAAAASLISASLKWAYYAEGHTDRLLSWSVRILPVTVAAVALGGFWGATGVAIAWSATTTIATVPQIWWCTRRSVLSSADVWAPFLNCLVAAIAGATASLLVMGSEPSGLTGIATSFLVVAGVSIVVTLALPGGRNLSRRLLHAFLRMRQGKRLQFGDPPCTST